MIEIPVNSDRHKHILTALLARVKMSENAMQTRFWKWEEADKDFNFWMPEREVDNLRRQAKEAGKPQYVTIEIPYAYAQMMAAHTYFSSVFLSKSPIWHMQARHGEPEMNVQAVEALMDYQVQVGGMLPALYVWLHDAAKYGLGVILRHWDDEVRTISRFEEEPVMLFGQPVEGATEKKKITENIPGYQGNRLVNIRCYDYLPDTRVPLNQPNKGEFVGWKTSVGWNTVMKRKLSGQYFNIDFVKDRVKGASTNSNEQYASIISDAQLPSELDTGWSHESKTSLVSKIPAIEMVVELIPKEWMLGQSEYPEKWVFTIFDRKVIVEARPFGLWHDRFPTEVLETEIEGYQLVKRGYMDIGRPLNDVMTWLFNSHFYAVRKTLNGDIVYDPSRVVSGDVLGSDGTGSRIRVKPAAYGQDIRTMIHVMQGGADITGTHLRDTEVVGSLLQRIMGVNDQSMGVMPPGGRRTATENRLATSGSINRQRTISEYMSATGFAPLAQQILLTTQQLYTGEKKYRIVGDSVNDLEQFVLIDRDRIAGAYDYAPVDGTLPLDRFALVNMWAQLLAQTRNFPQIAQEYDIGKIFAWVAQLAGIKNIKQFKVQLLPPGVAPGQGSLPLGGQNGGAGTSPGGATGVPGGTTGDGGAGGPVVPIPRQIPGVGRSG